MIAIVMWLALQDVSVEEKVLAKLPEMAPQTTVKMWFRPDGRAVAFEVAGKLTIDGVAAETGARNFVYGAAGDTAYFADGTVIFNGTKGKKYSHVSLGPFVTARREAVYWAHDGDLAVLVVGAKAYDLGRRASLLHKIAPNGRVAYVVPGDKPSLYVDGKKLETGVSVSNLVFSPDGKRLAYSVNDDFVAVDGKRGPKWEQAFAPAVTNAGRVAHGVRKDGQYYMAVDGKVVGEGWDAVGPAAYAPTGTTLAYYVRRGGSGSGENHTFIVGNKKHGPYYSLGGVDTQTSLPIAGIHFSPDGSSWAFRTGLNSQGDTAVVCDGKKGDTLKFIQEPLVVANGGHVAYRIIEDKRQMAIIDGVVGTPYDEVSLPIFSADGKKSAYWARKGQEVWVRAGDAEAGPFRSVAQLAFTVDGSKIGFGAWIADELWWKVVDAK